MATSVSSSILNAWVIENKLDVYFYANISVDRCLKRLLCVLDSWQVNNERSFLILKFRTTPRFPHSPHQLYWLKATLRKNCGGVMRTHAELPPLYSI